MGFRNAVQCASTLVDGSGVVGGEWLGPSVPAALVVSLPVWDLFWLQGVLVQTPRECPRLRVDIAMC